ncbi:hypothetical protein A0H81_04036 [Grifola frondosa]|uniref:Secreted protein n=1 Tax=Grifola frondosa TaxID=5627 RepID=A0A1C7MHQ2_GRIFR|nr:hypothetical protein A0H81_04036 [Grifola frondosa]
MPAVIVLSLFAALFLCCVLFPSILASITAGDEILDAHEAGLAIVASRTPFRETGPPACMAKLIMLRHKIHQDNTRRRNNRAVPWVRFGRARGKQNY